MAGQPTWVDFSDGSGVEGTSQGTRFPLLALGYPGFGGVVTLQMSSFLDQRFHGQRQVTVELVGGSASAIDAFDQDGSASLVSVGFSRMLGDRTSVGVHVGRFTGSVTRTLSREFGEGEVPGAEPFESSGRWSYTGASVTGGASTDIGDVARIGASATWSSGLYAEATSTTEGADRSFDLPLELRVGASAVLAPGLVLSASAALADWSSMEDDLASATPVGSTNGFGVGVELSRARLLGRAAPLRFGFRTRGLPFPLDGGEASERVFSAGLGLALNETNNVLLAGVDFSIERGRRTSGSITENFWRATASVRVAGF
jgi:hypothetical protein